jgi:hypothetical protein
MISNIIDNRKRRYRWRSIDAVIEPAWHDNKCGDSDQAEPCIIESEYNKKNNISVSDAISWALEVKYDVTLFLYDKS